MTTAHDLRLSADPAADEDAAYFEWADEVWGMAAKLPREEQLLFWLRRMTPERALACILNDIDAVQSDYYDRTQLARSFPGNDNPAPTLGGSAADYVRKKA